MRVVAGAGVVPAAADDECGFLDAECSSRSRDHAQVVRDRHLIPRSPTATTSSRWTRDPECCREQADGRPTPGDAGGRWGTGVGLSERAYMGQT
jgi:hypothetical protein